MTPCRARLPPPADPALSSDMPPTAFIANASLRPPLLLPPAPTLLLPPRAYPFLPPPLPGLLVPPPSPPPVRVVRPQWVALFPPAPSPPSLFLLPNAAAGNLLIDRCTAPVSFPVLFSPPRPQVWGC